MEIKKLELLNNFMDEVKEFTKRICKDVVQGVEDDNISVNDYFISLCCTSPYCSFNAKIFNGEKTVGLSTREEYHVNLIDFINNQNEHINQYKDLIINSLKDDKLIVKSNLCFILFDSKNDKNAFDLLKFHEKRMHYLRLCSDLDYNSTKFLGTLDSFELLYSMFSSSYKLPEEEFKGGKSERKKFFADYYTLIENVIGMNYKSKDINNLKHFFSEVGGNLTQKQIEAPFVKIIKNKTMEKHSKLLGDVNNIVCDLVGEDNIKSKELKNLQNKDNVEPRCFIPLSVEEFKAITFNNNYYSQYDFKYENPDCFRKLYNSQIESFNTLLMYLLTSENAQEIYGVIRSSALKLPTGEKGLLIQVNENYNEDKLHQGIGILCKFIQEETIRNPLDGDNPSFHKYKTEETLINLEPYLLEIKLNDAMNIQPEVNGFCSEKYKI